jgi:hypothetical protein
LRESRIIAKEERALSRETAILDAQEKFALDNEEQINLHHKFNKLLES